MHAFVDRPIVVFVISLVAMALAALLGAAQARRGAVHAESHEYFGVVQTGSLTLLALVVAFTFSMAVSRHDQRKNCEEEEANAVGTAYDVLNAQGYTQAAWWNRIPTAAWVLMLCSPFRSSSRWHFC